MGRILYVRRAHPASTYFTALVEGVREIVCVYEEKMSIVFDPEATSLQFEALPSIDTSSEDKPSSHQFPAITGTEEMIWNLMSTIGFAPMYDLPKKE